MKLNRDDDYYKLIYNWVDELDFIEGYEFLEAKSPNTDAFNHMHMEIKCSGGDITLRVDANGVMITCGCGCMGMQELDYFTVCEVQKQLNDLIDKDDQSNEPMWSSKYTNNDTIREMFDKMQNVGLNRSAEDKARMQLKRLERNIDACFDLINDIEDEIQREQFLLKLQSVLGTDK